MGHWTEFGVRHNPPMSGRTRVAQIAPPLILFVDERVALRGSPFLGVTTDGNPRRGLFELKPAGKSLAPLADAAQALLGGLTSEQRARAQQPLDSEDWRTWINVHMNFFPHGVMLEDLDVTGSPDEFGEWLYFVTVFGDPSPDEPWGPTPNATCCCRWRLPTLAGHATGTAKPRWATSNAISTRHGSRGWAPRATTGRSTTGCTARWC